MTESTSDRTITNFVLTAWAKEGYTTTMMVHKGHVEHGERAELQGSRRVVVSLDDVALNDSRIWKDTVVRLRKLGLLISKELELVGVVAGTVPDSKIPLLQREPHVVKVEDDERRSTQ